MGRFQAVSIARPFYHGVLSEVKDCKRNQARSEGKTNSRDTRLFWLRCGQLKVVSFNPGHGGSLGCVRGHAEAWVWGMIIVGEGLALPNRGLHPKKGAASSAPTTPHPILLPGGEKARGYGIIPA